MTTLDLYQRAGLQRVLERSDFRIKLALDSKHDMTIWKDRLKFEGLRLSMGQNDMQLEKAFTWSDFLDSCVRLSQGHFNK